MKHIIFVISLFLILASSPLIAAKVDINTADAQTLQENMVGIGEVKAKAIVKHRKKHGKFMSLDDLMQVPGIGKATVEKNRKNLSFKGSASNSKKTAASKNSNQKKTTAGKTTTTKKTKAKTKKTAKKQVKSTQKDNAKK